TNFLSLCKCLIRFSWDLDYGGYYCISELNNTCWCN
ncbi:Branched-chain amino acid transport system 2 carrier protein, partial [Haemophilus influenzae]